MNEHHSQIHCDVHRLVTTDLDAKFRSWDTARRINFRIRAPANEKVETDASYWTDSGCRGISSATISPPVGLLLISNRAASP